MNIDVIAANEIIFLQQAIVANTITQPIYGSVQNATNYFFQKIENQAWERAEQQKRINSLIEATRIIDSLSYVGEREGSLKFPRDCDTIVPPGIEIACYEIAYALLDGISPDREAENLSVTSQGYAGARTTYDRSFVPAHIRAGIPSFLAWKYLRPYLIDPASVTLSRVD